MKTVSENETKRLGELSKNNKNYYKDLIIFINKIKQLIFLANSFDDQFISQKKYIIEKLSTVYKKIFEKFIK